MNIFEEIITDIAHNGLTYIILIIAIAACIIIILREVRCWYWKINEMIDLQRQEIDALQDIIELQIEEIDLLKSNVFTCNKSNINESKEEESNES